MADFAAVRNVDVILLGEGDYPVGKVRIPAEDAMLFDHLLKEARSRNPAAEPLHLVRAIWSRGTRRQLQDPRVRIA